MRKHKKTTPLTPLDPEAALLRHVVTLGTLIKILLGVGSLIIGVGVYEINQLDKLRDQANTLQSTMSGLQAKVDANQIKLLEIQGSVDKTGSTVNELIKEVTLEMGSVRKGGKR